jgi:serine/threonine protein kinase
MSLDSSAFPPPDWERYKVVRLLGRGVMSQVFLAHDPGLRRDIALKFVRSDDAELVRRLISEARVMARVHHEHICQVYEVGEVKGGAYIAMQFVDGAPLKHLADELALDQKVRVIRDAAEGVYAAHRAGLVHCDLKPSNILVERTEDGHLKPFVMDFGMARDWSDEGAATPRGVHGTQFYMAPELVLGKPSQLDRRTDVYGLGATLYFLLTGEPPGVGTNVNAVSAHFFTAEVRPPSSLVSDIPLELDAIVHTCLQRNPSSRFDSVRKLINALDFFLAKRPLQQARGLGESRLIPGSGSTRISRRVFISYTHETDAQKEQVLQLAQRLRRDGMDCRLDRFIMSPPEGWPHWTRRELEQADFVLVICTELYRSRFDHRGEVPHGAGWEAGLIQQALYDSDSRNEKFIPVLLTDGSERHVPGPLRGASRYRIEAEYEALLRRLTGQPEVVPAQLGQVPQLPAQPQGLVMSSGAISQSSSQAPVYRNEQERTLAEQLSKLVAQKEELLIAGQSTHEVQQRILELRRVMREGARLQAGDLLGDGRYNLLEQAGKGGFASIWRAFDRQRQEFVAIKVLHGHLAEERTAWERFFRGARRMAKLDHPGIVRVLKEEVTEGNFHFFVMEFIPGGDLKRAILERKLDAQSGLRLLLQVVPALAYAHERGLVHRDVKPANILVGAGQPKLTDFDLVWAADTTQGTAGALGTVAYAAPEVSTSMGEVTPAADVYSMAMCVVFTLSGQELPMAVLRNTSQVIDRLPCGSDTRSVLHRALEIDPARRFQSISEFAEALARSLGAQASTGAMQERSPRPTNGEPVKARHPMFWRGLVAAIVLAALGILTLMLR